MATIDLNADLGETVDGVPTADDAALYPLLSSANVACGGHAGDETSMRAAVAHAERLGVAIGAHPSYPDRSGFGRVRLDLAEPDLRAVLVVQIAALVDAGADLRYVKPHGALYHAIRTDAAHARAVASAVSEVSDRLGRPLSILGQDGEITRAASDAGLPFRREAFLDRGYLASGALVPRGQPGDLLHDGAEVAARAVRLATEGVVLSVDSEVIRTDAVSLCIHADSPGAVMLARAARAALDAAGVTVRAPW